MVFLISLLLYITSFVAIWFGSGLIVSSTSHFSKKLKLSQFMFSFIFLGILTSVPEFSIGLQSIADKNPGIFVGNLLGGIIVLFLVVIPLLAIFGNGISLKHELGNKTLLLTLLIILTPSIFVLDKRVSQLEGVFLVILYLILLVIVERRHGIFDRQHTQVLNFKAYSYKDVFRIILGIAVVFLASTIIVDKTMYFANFFNISVFYISLIVVSLGTNLPELSLAIRSILNGSKNLAMGDYIGSAAANTLLFGVFTVMNNGEVLTVDDFFVTFLFIFTALGLFYFFSATRQTISRRDGFLLLCVYVLFLFVEIF